MKIHNISLSTHSYHPEDQQLIDLDYIVSIGPLVPISYQGFYSGHPHIDFTIYIKVGYPIVISIKSIKNYEICETDKKFANEERTKLIKAWEERKAVI